MQQTTTELTHAYLREHPEIVNCLKKDLVNYSALARRVAKDLKIEQRSSKEAILIAARRFRRTLAAREPHDKEIAQLLAASEINVRNKVTVLIVDKRAAAHEAGAAIHKEGGLCYAIEGAAHTTLFFQDRHEATAMRFVRNHVVRRHAGLALLHLVSSAQIEKLPGVVAYLAGLFSEHGVNIVELCSCWRDTIIVIDAADVPRAMQFLKFSS